ncbi:MAG: hypothetical protein WC250_03475 [Candidatus Paceibacterota bacterium]|jgi:hypothetical protein
MNREKVHPVEVPGRALESNSILGEAIGRLRYDQQPLILEALAKELGRQSKGDRKRGRIKLSALLARAQTETLALKKTFGEILKLCRPYMSREFEIWPEAKKIRRRR